MVFTIGVKVAVHIMPPYNELNPLNVPLATVRSVLEKPVTASEKVMVTKLVSPILKTLSSTIIVAVGLTPSITIFLFAPNDPAVPGFGNVKIASLEETSFIVPPFNDKALRDT